MMRRDISSKAGFVAVVGRPNAGKSTLVNALVKERIALVSHKAGATRRRQLAIVQSANAQIILIDTPGFDKREKELNKFMQKEIVKSIEEADLALLIIDMADSVSSYINLLEIIGDIPHIIALTKMDNFTHDERLVKLAAFQAYSDRFLAIVPISAKQNDYLALLDEIVKHLPCHDYYYDPEYLTTATIKEIYKEMIREAIFDCFSDELPYSSDVMIDNFEESETIDRISAIVYVEKPSQKAIVIGKDGAGIKRLGISARKIIEAFAQKKIYLKLRVAVLDNWSKDATMLNKLGYSHI
jgi:GTP-binding protein Era